MPVTDPPRETDGRFAEYRQQTPEPITGAGGNEEAYLEVYQQLSRIACGVGRRRAVADLPVRLQDQFSAALADALESVSRAIQSGKVSNLSAYIHTTARATWNNSSPRPHFDGPTASAMAELNRLLADVTRRDDPRIAEAGKAVWKERTGQGVPVAWGFWMFWKSDPDAPSGDDLSENPAFSSTPDFDDFCPDPDTAAAAESAEEFLAASEAVARDVRTWNYTKKMREAWRDDHQIDLTHGAVLALVAEKTRFSRHMASWAKSEDGAYPAWPAPGALTVAQADDLARQFTPAYVDRAVQQWWMGDDDMGLFAPFGSITPERKDAIATYLLRIRDPQMRADAAKEWASLAKQGNENLAHAVTDPARMGKLILGVRHWSASHPTIGYDRPVLTEDLCALAGLTPDQRLRKWTDTK
jgi:hypothetical protein